MPPIILVWNGKGGVGKTTTAVHLAVYSARSRPTLLVDLDAQGDATRWLEAENALSTTQFITGTWTESDLVALSPSPQLAVTAGTEDLADVPRMLDGDLAGAWKLRNALHSLSEDRVVILDAPPEYGALVALGMVAATHHILPTRVATLDFTAAEEASARVAAVTASSSTITQQTPITEPAGIVLCATDQRSTIDREFPELVARRWPNAAIGNIPAAVAMRKAPALHTTIDEIQPGNRAEGEYHQLLAHILKGSTNA